MTDNYVLACIDGAALSTAVCDYAAWIASRVQAPVKLLHNLEHRPQAAVADLSGSIGLGSQEELLEELTRVEQERSRLLMQKGKLMLKAAEERVHADGVEQVECWQRHGSLQESLIENEQDIRVGRARRGASRGAVRCAFGKCYSRLAPASTGGEQCV